MNCKFSRWSLSISIVLLTPLLPMPVWAQGASIELTPLAVIQGNGPASPLVGQKVTTWGLVTGVTSDGFYLQDPVGDGNPATSDAIFAYTHDAPTEETGQCYQVSGEVDEYYAKSELNWLTAVTPSQICGAPVVTPVTMPTIEPGSDPNAALEAFEGMVVQLPAMNGIVHEPTKRFASGEAELAFLPAQWQRTIGLVHLFQGQPALSGLLYVSNLLGANLPDLGWGDEVHIGSNGLTGVLDYNFGKYQLLPWAGQIFTVTANSAIPAPLPPLRADEYGICTFNLHGFGRGTEQLSNPAEYAAALQQRAEVIATQLVGCTIIGLQETGSPDDAQALAATLTTDFGLAYSALSLPGPTSYAPDFPLTNSILIDASRVNSDILEAVGGCALQDFSVNAPGVCPAGAFPVFERPPLLAKLEINGPPGMPWPEPSILWVIDNHWKSKIGDENANILLRAAQATAVAARVKAITAADPDAQIVVLGDFNDYYEGAAVSVLQSATGLLHAYQWLPPLDRYSYSYNGAAQVLDHLLLTPNLAPQLALVRILHLYSNAPTGDSTLAHSDHDPVIVRVRPEGAALISGTLTWAGIGVSASDSNGALLAETITDANGDFRLWGAPLQKLTLQLNSPNWIVLDDPAHLFPQPLSHPLTWSVDAVGGAQTPALPRVRHTTAMTGAWLALSTPWLADTLIQLH